MSAKALLLCFISSAFAACPDGSIFDDRFNKYFNKFATIPFRCYLFITENTSFPLAQESCKSMGGSLVSASNAYENSNICNLAAIKTYGIFWIGIDLLYYDDWTWISGDNSSYRNWAVGQPNSAHPCGAAHIFDTYWTTFDCNSQLPYMCQIDPWPVSSCPTPPPKPVACPAGNCHDPSYILNPDTCKCYKWLGGGLSYEDSVQRCSSNNSTLPIILTEADNRFLSLNYKGHYPWLGLGCESNVPRSCTWLDESPLGYSNFAPGSPQGHQVVFLQPRDELWYSDTSGTGDCVCQKSGIP